MRHYFGIWVSFIFQIMFLVFQRTKGNSLCILILWRLHGNSLCIFTRWWMNATDLFPWFEKLCVNFFLQFFSSVPNMVKGSAFLQTHIWLIESEVLPCLSHLVMIERGEGETASLSIILLTTIVRIGVSYFLVTIYIYIYIYIYIF